jgi:Arm DNA-binding domain
MYRYGSVKRRLTIGTYPGLSLAEAREKAAYVHHAVQYSGADPSPQRRPTERPRPFPSWRATTSSATPNDGSVPGARTC